MQGMLAAKKRKRAGARGQPDDAVRATEQDVLNVGVIVVAFGPQRGIVVEMAARLGLGDPPIAELVPAALDQGLVFAAGPVVDRVALQVDDIVVPGSAAGWWWSWRWLPGVRWLVSAGQAPCLAVEPRMAPGLA
jgi:hypothetical protein